MSKTKEDLDVDASKVDVTESVSAPQPDESGTSAAAASSSLAAPQADTKRLSVSLGPNDVRNVASVVQTDAVTANEAIRRAIQTDAFIRGVLARGGKVLTEDKNGVVREVEFTHLG